jgi:hypothetical protein
LVLCGAVLLTAAPGKAAPGATGITVSGTHFYLDGHLFVPRGLSMVGLLKPPWCFYGRGREARLHYGEAEFAAARQWGANTLRLQVSQRGLADPSIEPAQRQAYLNRVTDGVALARAAGFVVIVSLQDQWLSCGRGHKLPTNNTLEAWRILIPALAEDRSIMFELFNEPQNDSSAAGWHQWQWGGSKPLGNLGTRSVGHQILVNAIRKMGARNVLIVDGGNYAGTLDGVPMLTDPLRRLAYGIHPFYYTLGKSDWDRRFGDLSTRTRVIADEWNFKRRDCGTLKQRMAPSLIQYLKSRHIGLFAHGFDIVGAAIANWEWDPTACGTRHPGSGFLVRKYLRSFLAVHRPDVSIKLGSDSSYIGAGIYNTTGTGQTRVVNTTRGATRTFVIAVQNRGSGAEGFKLKGLGGATNFTVKYLAGGTGTNNITGGVLAGTYTLRDVPAGGVRHLRMVITVKRTAAIGSSLGRLITATSTEASTAKDAVKGSVNVSRS